MMVGVVTANVTMGIQFREWGRQGCRTWDGRGRPTRSPYTGKPRGGAWADDAWALSVDGERRRHRKHSHGEEIR